MDFLKVFLLETNCLQFYFVQSPNGGKKTSLIFPFFFNLWATNVTGRKTSGGQMMSFIDKLTAHEPTERPCHCFRLNLSTHLPSLPAALSNKRSPTKKRRTRAQIWFPSIGNRASSWCCESPCSAYFLLMCCAKMIQIAFCVPERYNKAFGVMENIFI